MPFLNIKKNTEKPQNLKTAYFAGGCFWCVESDFDKLTSEGIYEVTSGYAGGNLDNPSYENHADHLESVEVKYDGDKISFNTLVEYFLRHIDPTDENGQFYDRGNSYTTAVFYQTEAERQIVKEVLKKIENNETFSKPVVTKVLPFKNFFPAEDYHQKYYKKNPLHYKAYRIGSGRDKFIKEHWS